MDDNKADKWRDAVNNMYDDESKGHEGLTSAGFEGDLFNEGSEVNFDEAFTEMEGSEALGIGFEESETNTNINMYHLIF